MPLKPFDGTLKQNKALSCARNNRRALKTNNSDSKNAFRAVCLPRDTRKSLLLSVDIYMPTWLALGLANHIGVWRSETVR